MGRRSRAGWLSFGLLGLLLTSSPGCAAVLTAGDRKGAFHATTLDVSAAAVGLQGPPQGQRAACGGPGFALPGWLTALAVLDLPLSFAVDCALAPFDVVAHLAR